MSPAGNSHSHSRIASGASSLANVERQSRKGPEEAMLSRIFNARSMDLADFPAIQQATAIKALEISICSWSCDAGQPNAVRHNQSTTEVSALALHMRGISYSHLRYLPHTWTGTNGIRENADARSSNSVKLHIGILVATA